MPKWEDEYDQGVKLHTVRDDVSGVRGSFIMPVRFASPHKASFFNCYAGFNRPGGQAHVPIVEAGYSYSFHEAAVGAPILSYFVNPGESRKIGAVCVYKKIGFQLTLENGRALLQYGRINNEDAGGNRTKKDEPIYNDIIQDSSKKPLPESGQLKLLIALHENIHDQDRRKVWFDSVGIVCDHVRIKTTWVDALTMEWRGPAYLGRPNIRTAKDCTPEKIISYSTQRINQKSLCLRASMVEPYSKVAAEQRVCSAPSR